MIMVRRSLLLALLVLTAYSVVPAQTSKLVGIVIEAATKEPLIGANVVIVGTTLGAVTDIEGHYSILNIPPGKYSVQASLLGYATVLQKEVAINIDRTTSADFSMVDASIEMNQVVVVATRPPVVKDRTSTSTTMDVAQIASAPIEGLRGALSLSAGVQKSASGEYSVRGSGNYEVNVQINGVEQITSNTSAPGTFGSDKANNSWKMDVNPLGVQQMELITGGFSAEYGNAQAGVMKVALKEGTPKFTGEFRAEYRPAGQYHYDKYLYDKSNFEWQEWGELSDWMAKRDQIILELNLNVRYEHLKNTDIQKYNEAVDKEIAWAYNIWLKNHTPGDGNVLGVYDYRKYAYTRYLFGFGGPLGKDPNLLKFFVSGEYKRNPTRLPSPEKVQTLQNYILNVTYQPVPNNKIRLMGSYQSYIGGIWSGSDDIRWSGLAYTPPGVSTKYLLGIDPVRSEQTTAQSVNWVHTFNSNSFLDLTLFHQQERYEIPFRYLAGFGVEVDRLDSLSDPYGSVLKDGSWWEEKYFRAPFSFSTNYYQDSRTESYSMKLDYTNQISQTNLLKTGITVQLLDMINNGVNSSFQANSFVARNGFAEYYRAYPYNVAMYAQDKMEYAGMIANIGLRAEVYSFNTQVPLDRFNFLYPGTDGPSGVTGNPLTRDSETKFILQPRIGLSFPIGVSTAFRVQYGHFTSMPVFSQALAKKTWVGWQGIANPDLDPKKTINYEFGLQQAFGDRYRSDIVLYYNDRTSQVGTQSIASYTGSRNQFAGFSSDNSQLYYYSTYANNAFGSTVGFEASFETITYEDWSYRLSYSLSQTTSGNYGARTVYPDNTRGYSERNFTGEFIAPWDRTHNFRALVQYFWKENEGFEIFTIRPLSNSVISFTYSAQSGTPYTYVTEFTLKDVVYNRRYPLESGVDLNFTKNITVNDFRFIMGIRVMNLFDNKWITPMSTSEDIKQWVDNGITIADPGTDPTRWSYLVAPYAAYRNLPRQIFFTLGVGM
jgi:outer membrane receptor protein involved in Fe transport